MMTYDALEARVAAWAATQPTIRTIIVVGSRARGNHDRWSDLDLVIFTTDPERYIADPGWLHSFGDPWLTFLENAGGGDPEWFVLYDGGLKLDAMLYRTDDATLDLDAMLAAFPYQDVLSRGVRILFDRSGSPRYITPKPFMSPPPTQEAFIHLGDGFLLNAVTGAKFIARGDLWRAQRWLSENLRRLLLTLVEWHAYGRDTWYGGRFIETWADPRVLETLPQIFPQYDPSSMKRALLAMLDLFRWLGQETADRFGYEYPAAHDRAASLIHTVLSGTGTPDVS